MQLKPYQLFLAQSSGLIVPETLITTDAKSVLEFVRRLALRGQEAVYKYAHAATPICLPTTTVRSSDLECLHTLQYAPVTFQERIRSGANMRIAVLGQRIFACEWKSDEPDPLDIRLAQGAHMSPSACPPELIEPLTKFHRRSGLTFGVYDFRLNAQGTAYFLEVNPSGQWLDMEVDGKQPISEAWARLLVDGTDAVLKTESEPFTHDDLQMITAPVSALPRADQWRTVA